MYLASGYVFNVKWKTKQKENNKTVEIVSRIKISKIEL